MADVIKIGNRVKLKGGDCGVVAKIVVVVHFGDGYVATIDCPNGIEYEMELAELKPISAKKLAEMGYRFVA